MHLIHVALLQGAFAPGSAQGGPAGGQLGGQQPGGGSGYLGGMTLIPGVSLAMQPGAGGSYAIQAATLAQQQQMQLAMVAQQRALAAQQAAVKQQKAAASAVRTPPVPGVGNPAQGPAGQRAERDLKAVVWQRREEVRQPGYPHPQWPDRVRPLAPRHAGGPCAQPRGAAHRRHRCCCGAARLRLITMLRARRRRMRR